MFFHSFLKSVEMTAFSKAPSPPEASIVKILQINIIHNTTYLSLLQDKIYKAKKPFPDTPYYKNPLPNTAGII